MAKKTTKVATSPIEENQKKYNEYVASLEGKSTDELKAMEQDLIKLMDENDKKVSDAKFKLPNGYSEFRANVIYFLDKQTVQWQYALGMLELVESLKEDMKEIAYPLFDVIVSNLGQLQFKGVEEWKKVKQMTEYVKPISEEYAVLKAYTYLLAEEHSAILNKLGVNDPNASNPQSK